MASPTIEITRVTTPFPAGNIVKWPKSDRKSEFALKAFERLYNISTRVEDVTNRIAEHIQQDHYELNSDTWLRWNLDDLELLQKDLLISIYGINRDESITCGEDWMEALSYTQEQLKVMNKIFEQIYLFGKDDEGGITTCKIYNVFYCTKIQSKSKKKEEEIEEHYPISETPIYKFVTNEEPSFWYIDYTGRVYKTWDDYKNNNTLPKCTMVLPKEGEYQADPDQPVTPHESHVWLEILPSPATNVAAGMVDKLATGLSLATIPFAFTPIGGPMVLAGVAAMCVSSSAWVVGRSVTKLVDRAQHKESIKPNNLENVSHWAGIAGGSMGLMASGGTALLANAASRGRNVGTIAQHTFNVLNIGEKVCLGLNSTISGVQIFHQYKTTKEIPYTELLHFAVQVFMLSHSVVKMKFASEIIISSQGRYIEDFKSELKSKTHKRAFQRVQSKARERFPNNTRAQQSEVIQHIKRVQVTRDLKIIPTSKINLTESESRFTFIDKLPQINGIKLLHPMSVVKILIDQISESSTEDLPHDVFWKYVRMFSEIFEYSPFTRSGYHDLFREMRGCSNLSDVLVVIFKIAKRLSDLWNNKESMIFELIKFLWDYLLENLREHTLDRLSYIENPDARQIFHRIAQVLFCNLEMMGPDLLNAFEQWIASKQLSF